jgi:CRP/FNR family transcriptional regulator
MGADEQMLIIRRTDFLDKLTPDEYESLNILHNYVVADKDTYIYFDAQYHNKLYFVKEGYVRIGNVDDNGEELVKEILQPGDVFGQFMLERSSMNGEFAQAHKCDTVLCAFSVPDFERLLTIRPDLSIAFSRKIGAKLRKIENQLLSLLQKDVRTRLLHFFWTMLQQGSANGDNTAQLPNFLTHEDIARLTGTSRQTVTTLINKFAAEGLISVDRKSIVFLDIRSLQKQVSAVG